MLLLVALAAWAGLFVLLAPLMIVRYLLSWPVLGFLIAFVAFLLAPLLYAWRTRPFQD